ncbi:putative membrane protein YczE [Oikeobacillus pervagus]|uniref:Membrane protein YczE n=1 Tax=Oikeobacillus pervagus TaxID=1325931 RepID=A0AAJ1WK05_9BACI|nr:YitT family protein [Oikeobacillus pervagus]MDQ0214606.1 putative membrane protein YczE [Oikeobacillus pervagus]
MNKRKGNVLARLIIFMLGLLIMSLGIVMLIRADLGAMPWDVLHVGLFQQIGLTVGTWSIIVGFCVLISASILMQEWPKFGAYLNMVLVGMFIDMYLSFSFLATPESLFLKCIMFVFGIIITGYGMGLYISAQMGAGPRDSFMLAVIQKTGWKIAHVRRGMEVVVLFVGWQLGGPVHIGTIMITFFMGTVSGLSIPQCQMLTDTILKKFERSKQGINNRGVNL